MNWPKIGEWTFYVFAAFLFSWFLINVLGYWGMPASAGYAYAAVWLFVSVATFRMANQLNQISKSALAGWEETLKGNDSLIDMIGRLKVELKNKDAQLAEKIIYIKPTHAEDKRPTKRRARKVTHVKRRGSVRR